MYISTWRTVLARLHRHPEIKLVNRTLAPVTSRIPGPLKSGDGQDGADNADHLLFVQHLQVSKYNNGSVVVIALAVTIWDGTRIVDSWADSAAGQDGDDLYLHMEYEVLIIDQSLLAGEPDSEVPAVVWSAQGSLGKLPVFGLAGCGCLGGFPLGWRGPGPPFSLFHAALEGSLCASSRACR